METLAFMLKINTTTHHLGITSLTLLERRAPCQGNL